MYLKVAKLPVVMMFVAMATGCTITGFVEMGMMERLVQSLYVVYGRTIWHSPTRVKLNGKSQYVIEATFEIHCIFKEFEDSLTEEITIQQISPALNCSGTDVTKNLKVGDYSIIALKKGKSGKYMLQEVMPETSATFYPMKPYFFSIANTCDMQRWKSPIGATTNRCPICGISNFAQEVTTLENSAGQVTNCEFTSNTIINDMTQCDLYVSGTIDYANAQTCIPASFNQTCVNLLYRSAADASCDCEPKTTKRKVGTSDGYKLGASQCGLVLMLLLSASAVF